jgi:hypothetical protein
MSDVINCNVSLVKWIVDLQAEPLLPHYLHHVVAHSCCHKLIESVLVKAAIIIERWEQSIKNEMKMDHLVSIPHLLEVALLQFYTKLLCPSSEQYWVDASPFSSFTHFPILLIHHRILLWLRRRISYFLIVHRCISPSFIPKLGTQN